MIPSPHAERAAELAFEATNNVHRAPFGPGSPFLPGLSEMPRLAAQWALAMDHVMEGI